MTKKTQPVALGPRRPNFGLSSLICGETLEEDHLKPFVPLNAALVKLPGLFVKPLNCPDRRRDIFYCADNHRVAQNKAPRFLELVPSQTGPLN